MNKTVTLKITKEELIEAINEFFGVEFPEMDTDITHPMTGESYIKFDYTYNK